MTKLKSNHARALKLAATLLPDFEVIEEGSINSCTDGSIILWPVLNVLTINFKSTGFFVLNRVDIIRRLVDMRLTVKKIGVDACYAEFSL